MLPACVTIPATGGDVTKILPAFWLCITIPASGEDVTIVFSALSLCVIVAATLSDGTVKMPISINEGSCSTSAHKDHWLKTTCLGRLKCKFKNVIGLAGTISKKRSQVNPPSVGMLLPG